VLVGLRQSSIFGSFFLISEAALSFHSASGEQGGASRGCHGGLVATDLAAGATGDRWSSAWRAGTTVDEESGDPAAGATGVDERRASRACSTCGGENSHSRAWKVHLLLDWYSSAFSLGPVCSDFIYHLADLHEGLGVGLDGIAGARRRCRC
jgi:hypothetical protein